MSAWGRTVLGALVLVAGATRVAAEPAGEAWAPFAHETGRYRVLAPGPMEERVKRHWTLAGPIQEVAHHFDWRGERYGVTWFDLPRIATALLDEDYVLDRAVEDLLEQMDGDLLRTERTASEDGPGRSLAYRVREDPGLVEQVRLLLVERRLYILEAATRPAADPGGAAAERFFDSFGLLGER